MKKMPKIKISFLGVGSAFSRKYGNTSALVSINNDGVVKNLLIDCGRTTPDDLVSAGYTWKDIDAIFISHLHGDHCYGLEDAGYMGRYVFEKKPHIIFPHDKLRNDLWEKVLKGTMMNGDLSRSMRFEDYFTYESVSREEQYFDFNGVMFSVYTTIHIPNKKSYGLIIGEKDYIIYTADSLLNKDFLELAHKDGCKAIFHDCQFMHYPTRVHASLDDLMTLDEEIRKTIYIMHYQDNIGEYYTKIKDAGLKVALRNTIYEFEVGSYSLTNLP
jgi:ribonuclease BN (tRNA processing enzyme)